MELFLDILSFGFCCLSYVNYLCIMQATTTVHLHVEGVNCNTSYGNDLLVWKGNIKLDLQELRCGDFDWVEGAQDIDR